MKIVAIADLHLNKVAYRGVMDREFVDLHFRSADFMRAFRWMVDRCVNEIKPDLVVIPGDTYDYYEPTNEIRGFYSLQLSRFVENNIPCIILIGNHDVCKKHHALKDIQELKLKNIRVVETPKIVSSFKGTRLLLFPYSLDIERKKISLRDEFQKFVKEVKNNPSDLPTIFFGHFGVKGGILNDYTKTEILEGNETDTDTTTTLIEEKKQYLSRREEDIDEEWLDLLGADHVILGDFHRHQKLNTKCYSMYTGSVERTDIKEVEQKKGFIVYDSEAEIGELGKCRFVEYPNCRPMIQLKGNLHEMKEQFEKMDAKKSNGAIVKLAFMGNEKEKLVFAAGLNDFKKMIQENISAIHIYSSSDSSKTEEERVASEFEKELLEKGHITDDDILKAVNEMVDELVEDIEERKKTYELAEEIYKETKRN